MSEIVNAAQNPNHKIPAHKQKNPPESVVQVDTAKRNIIRKGSKGHYRKEGAVGGAVDDGSTYDYDVIMKNGAIDERDPNYDPGNKYLIVYL